MIMEKPRPKPIADWDDAYANRAHIPDADRLIAAWPGRAAAFRGEARLQADIRYRNGDNPRHTFDLFLPRETPQGLVVLIHGGYWMAFDKSTWSHLARGAVERGWAVALPSYELCPEVSIGEIGEQMADAVCAASLRVDGPIVLSGHSAGGQLVARLICDDYLLPPDAASRVVRVIGISGLYDLRPLMRTRMNETLQIDLCEAERESPALLTPIAGPEIVCWVGAEERPEFRRQNALLANIWTGLSAAVEAVEEPGRHHFSVIEGLADPASALVARLVG